MSTTNTAKTPPQANFRERNFFDFQSGGDIVSWGEVFLAVRFARAPPPPGIAHSLLSANNARFRGMKIAAAALLLAASLAVPATADADCGQDGQPACSGPVPTVDEVTAIVNEVADPNIPAGNKNDVVTPPFNDDQA
jgi:hypothetical protein